MTSTDGKHLDMSGASNAMYDGLGRPFIFSCRTNGALVWDQLRTTHGLKKEEYEPAERALRETPVGQFMMFWQPRDESFQFPLVMKLCELLTMLPNWGLTIPA